MDYYKLYSKAIKAYEQNLEEIREAARKAEIEESVKGAKILRDLIFDKLGFNTDPKSGEISFEDIFTLSFRVNHYGLHKPDLIAYPNFTWDDSFDPMDMAPPIHAKIINNWSDLGEFLSILGDYLEHGSLHIENSPVQNIPDIKNVYQEVNIGELNQLEQNDIPFYVIGSNTVEGRIIYTIELYEE